MWNVFIYIRPFASKVQAQEILIHNITIRKPDILSCGRMRIERSFEWIEMLKNLLKKIRSGLFYENNLWMYLYNRLELFFVIVERNIQWQRLIFKFDNKPEKLNESICLNGMNAILRKSPFHTMEIFTAYFYNGRCESIVGF